MSSKIWRRIVWQKITNSSLILTMEEAVSSESLVSSYGIQRRLILEDSIRFKLLKKKRKLLYIRNQSVPRCKHLPPRL
jgi:hypothetical protein